MGKTFVKNGELSLVNGGYLVTGKAQTPVCNDKFVALQIHAEWVVTFAEKAKGKDFVGKKPDSIEDVRAEVRQALSRSDVKYVSSPKEVKGDLTAKLQAEAMAFISFKNASLKTDKINGFLQQFNELNEFETFGLFFTEDIVKLNKIYTMQEVIAAVTEVIDVLN